MCIRDRYDQEQRVTRTRVAQILEGVGSMPFKVTFRKQVASNDVADALENEDADDMANKTKRRKILKRLMEGEERVMNARLVRDETFDCAIELGRVRVIDLDKTTPQKEEERLVDTRTISELIVNHVRYYV